MWEICDWVLGGGAHCGGEERQKGTANSANRRGRPDVGWTVCCGRETCPLFAEAEWAEVWGGDWATATAARVRGMIIPAKASPCVPQVWCRPLELFRWAAKGGRFAVGRHGTAPSYFSLETWPLTGARTYRRHPVSGKRQSLVDLTVPARRTNRSKRCRCQDR